MRTIQEIKDQFNKLIPNDLLGSCCDLLEFIPYEDAKEFLKPEVKKEDWTTKLLDEKTVIEEMRKYMTFALGKARNHRGISASRSIDHYKNWLWLLGDEETLAFAENSCNYQNYGVPILKKVCEKYGFKFPQDWDLQNMAKGLPCHEDCEEGCS
jgi:hypothetical protein